MANLIRNERVKLLSNWCNTIATAMLTVGVFSPLAATIYGIGTSVKDPDLLSALPWVCICAAIFLHLAGQLGLEWLDEGDE